MITDLKPYPAMKDSGVPWLGEVPEHWEVRRLGTLCTGFSNGTAATQLASGESQYLVSRIETISSGIIDYSKVGYLPNDEHLQNYYLIKGDILISHINSYARVGNIAQYEGEHPLLHGMNLIRVTPGKLTEPHFLRYLMSTSIFRGSMQRACKPAINQVSVTTLAIKAIPFPLPPLPEQAAIVRFLDYMDRRIRRYIRAKQKLIKLLEEQKQAIIHRAVTRGLDPNVRLKPSSVEWLGDVPEHWEVLPLKRIAWFKSGSGFPVNEQGNQGCELPFLRVSDMTREGNETWIETSDSTISRETAARLGAFVFPAGTIIFPKVGGALLTNKRRILRVESCIDNNVMGCVVGDVNRDYVFLLLEQIDLGRLAKPGPVPAISEGEIREIRVALPPLGEQARILYSVRAKTASLAAAILSTQREIALLREYRTRLIADVVTGKLDVREAAARLPEETDASELPDEIEDDAEEAAEEEDATESEEEAEA